MHNLRNRPWLTLAMLPIGVLFGSTAIAFLLVTNSAMPYASFLIVWGGLITPGCLALLGAVRMFASAHILLRPVLFLSGLTLPLNFAMACLLGMIEEPTLRVVIGILYVGSAWLLVIPASIYSKIKLYESAVEFQTEQSTQRMGRPSI